MSNGWKPNPLVHRLYRQGPSKMPLTPRTAAMTKQSATSASNTQRPRLLDARISSSVGSGCSGTAGSEVASVIPTDCTKKQSVGLLTYTSCKPDAYPREPKTMNFKVAHYRGVKVTHYQLTPVVPYPAN